MTCWQKVSVVATCANAAFSFAQLMRGNWWWASIHLGVVLFSLAAMYFDDWREHKRHRDFIRDVERRGGPWLATDGPFLFPISMTVKVNWQKEGF